MFKKIFMGFLLCVFSHLLPAQTIQVSSGIDNSGNPLPFGNNDPNWYISNLAVQAKAEAPHIYWENTPIATTNAQWIDMSGNLGGSNPNGPTVVHSFERSFTVNPGVASIQCNFSIAYDDSLVGIEIIRPDLSVVPLSFTNPSSYYHLTPITNIVSTNGLSGTFKIRARVNFYDGAAGFLCSGNIQLQKTGNTCVPAIADAMLHEFNPTTNYGSLTRHQASRWTYSSGGGSGFYTTKALERFDLSTIPSGATITSAIMTLRVCTTCTPYNQHYDLSGLGNAGMVQQVASSWNENTVNWNTAPSVGSAPAVIIPSPGNGSTSDLVANVTTMVQNMISSGNNFGFLISLQDNSDYYHSLNFATRENPDSSVVPSLCITYILNSCNLSVSTTGSGCGSVSCPYQCVGTPSGGTFSGPSGLNSVTGVYIGSIPAVGLPYTYTYVSGGCTYTANGLISKTTAASIPVATLSAYTGTTAAGAQVVVTWPSINTMCGDWYEFQLMQNGLPVSGCPSTFTSIAPSNTLPFGYTPLPAGTSGKIISCPGLILGQNYQVRMRVYRCNIAGQWSNTVNTNASKESTMNTDNTTQFDIKVYPNPIEEELHIELNSQEEDSYTVEVTDVSGRVVKRITQQISLGANQIILPLQELHSGIYLVQIRNQHRLIHAQKITK